MKLGGRYLLERELGRGGMGVVYLARDKPELHSRPVVVKVLLEEALKSEWVVKKFQQEIESLTRLDDPGVVGIFDAGMLDDGTPYLVMQYVEGTTLREAMKPDGMEFEQAAVIIRQVGRSIGAAHDAGILHRDLKPENIMLRHAKSREQQVKIIDFGIAKVKNSLSGPSPITNSTIGTFGYMSPEQLSAKPLTPASDIYSLGVIAYEMVTGRKPFTPDSMFQLLEMQRAGVRVKPGDLRPSVSEAAQQVLLKALAFDPNERYQDAHKFGEGLASALAGEAETVELPITSYAEQPESESSNVEIAHVLFMDIVGYSKLPIDDQKSVLERLNKVVRATQSFKHAEASNSLIRLPTGDGMALVFFDNPVAPLRCAVELSRVLQGDSKIKLRMGIHSGAVYRIADINTGTNVAGGGINIAQRVMDCGDADHILVSAAVADTLSQISAWAGKLHDLGEAEVKHGVRVRIFNVHTRDYGNAATPEKLLPSTPSSPAADTPEIIEPPPLYQSAVQLKPATNGLRVALLYKRNAQPDERILDLLEDELRGNGYDVFIDRHLSIGVEWAQEIEKQVRTADAVVPLLSAASSVSEMLAYEVQIAHEAAQQQNGKPRILPVRVNFEGSLPDPLGPILAPIQYFLWNGPQQDEALVDELLKSLRGPVAKEVAVVDLKEPGGAVALDSKLYIVRPTDEEFLNAIKKRDSIVLVKGARQMGKTSLLARGVQQARATGATVVVTDFQVLNSVQLASIDALFQTLGELIYDQLEDDLDVSPSDEWNPKRGASINFSRYIRKHVLGKLSTPLVWAMDEVDRLFSCEFGSEVFGLFRSWHNERALDPASPWERLTLAIVYATEAHLFITDQNQSPFNVGTRLELKDFTFEQVAEMNKRLGSPLENDSEVARFYRLVSGHPYLVHRGLHDMKTQGMSLNAFEDLADRDEGPFGDHLRRILVLLARDPALCDVMREVLRGRPCAYTESFYRLRSGGVMSGDSARDARPRCQLYATYLERHLL